jgi:hypothetical protein
MLLLLPLPLLLLTCWHAAAAAAAQITSIARGGASVLDLVDLGYPCECALRCSGSTKATRLYDLNKDSLSPDKQGLV